MNFIIWLVVGGLIGWIASKIMRTDAQQGVFLNIVVGIVGSMLGGWLISPLVGAGTINQSDFSLAGLFVSLVGAVILLAISNLFRRGKARERLQAAGPRLSFRRKTAARRAGRTGRRARSARHGCRHPRCRHGRARRCGRPAARWPADAR